MQVLNDQTFAILVIMALFTTFITTPIVVAIHKPAKKARSENKHRTIQRKEANGQLRLLTCFHNSRNIPSVINLIEASRGIGKKGAGVRVYAMHLMEYSERPSAILMVHKARKNGLPFWNKVQDAAADQNQIVVAFEAFRHLSRVSIKPTTAISRLSDIHEDICSSAEDKRVAMIILPFHKHLRLDGHLETTRTIFRHVNRKVLLHAPCSVGILVDRGLGGTSHVSASNVDYTIIALFFGGHDDREALTYGARMAEHPGINLVAVRFVLDPTVASETVSLDIDGNENSRPEARSEDEEFLSNFKQINQKEDGSIKYEEKMVKSSAETVEVIKSYCRCNLFLVGRMAEGEVVAALGKQQQQMECPELGPLGNLLTSSEFSTTASVLIVQQYRGEELPLDSLESLRDEVESTTEGEGNGA